MKKRAIVAAIAVLTVLSIGSRLSAAEPVTVTVEPANSVTVEGAVSTFNCSRNQKQPCVEILIFPKGVVEAYRLGGEKVASVDLSDPAIMKSGWPRFTLQLAPNLYLFLVHNAINGQDAAFGPVLLTDKEKRVQVKFDMYNLLPNSTEDGAGADQPSTKIWLNREMCFSQKVLEFVDPSATGTKADAQNEMVCTLETQKGTAAAGNPGTIPSQQIR